MAIINKTGITNGGTIQAEHITRVINALSGVGTDTVVITGSLYGTATSASYYPVQLVPTDNVVSANADTTLSSVTNAILIGKNAGLNSGNHTNCLALGKNSLTGCNFANDSYAIGTYSGGANKCYTNNIIIGNNIDFPEVQSHAMSLANVIFVRNLRSDYINTANVHITPDTTAKVGIGVYTNTTYQLQLSSDSAYKPSSGTWTFSSDIRLKDNIEEANYETCYNIVNTIPLKRYTWKSEAFAAEQVTDRSKLGWIAQDVETIFPKAVTTASFYGSGSWTTDGTGSNAISSFSGFYIEDCKALDSDQMYAAMYGTIKYLIAENNQLKNDIATIKTHLGL